MPVEYDYDLSAFTSLGANDIDSQQLHQEVNDASIGPTLYTIRVHSSDMHFKFSSSLSGAEQSTLDSIVSNHDGAGLNIVHETESPNSESQSTTTSTSYQTKLSYNVGILEAGVKYRIGWYCEVNNSSTSGRTQVEVAYNGTVIGNPQIESEDSNDWVPFCGFYYLPEDTAVTTITLKYRRQSEGTAKIRRARIEIRKAD